MTKEEIIELIKAYRDKLIDSASNQLDGDIEAFEMAVKALEQEPKTQMVDKSNFDVEQYRMDLQCAYDCGRASVEPSEDLISRQAVLDILEREGHKWGNDYRDWVDAIEEIKKLPSVNPQEPKICEKCLYAEETDGSHCYECVKGKSKFEPQESEDKEWRQYQTH